MKSTFLLQIFKPSYGSRTLAEEWVDNHYEHPLDVNAYEYFIAGYNQRDKDLKEKLTELFENRIAEILKMNLSKTECEHLVNEDEYMLMKIQKALTL